ncbi:MAG: 30S ribosomal protein S6 [Actinomycetota bacterium]|nr:30S ribosomal protein S6 [Actinomycetota bacterium]
MTRHYEMVYIFDSAMEEAQVNEHLERFHALLTTPEKPEPVTSVSHWGKRQLAYAIGGKEIGYYVVTQFEAPAAQLPEYERAIKLDDSVLRHLLVLNEGEAPRAPRTSDDDDDGGPDREEND